MKQDNARKWFKPEDWPALSALSLIILSLFLFGADTRIASLITSALILIITCIAQFIARDFRPTPWTVLFILIWAILLVVHLATNKVSGVSAACGSAGNGSGRNENLSSD